MRWTSLSLVFGLALVLSLWPGAAGAWGTAGFQGRVFVGPGHVFAPHHVFVSPHGFFPHRPFVHPFFRSDVVVFNNGVIVRPFPRAVWLPPRWQWNGVGWVLMPGGWGSPW
jgi:hypothetical protein